MGDVSHWKKGSSSVKLQVTKKQNEDLIRPLWSNKTEYILAQLGYSMGSVSLWTFHTLWLSNGGLFIILYILMLLLIGIPLLFMEMAFGQKVRKGNLGVWKFTSPWMTGLGYTSFMVCFLQGLLVNINNCWTLFYLSQSFQFPHPWDNCPLVKNSSQFDAECARTTPTIYFWFRKTLKVSDTFEHHGRLNTDLILCLLVACCLPCVISISGLKSIGKAMYVLVLLPYFIIFCFLIWSLLLEDALFGLKHLLTFKEVSIMDFIALFHEVGYHLLFSLGLGLGIIASFSSYMPSSNNCLTDAFAVALINLCTLLFITTVTFSVTGFWASIISQRCREKNVETLLKLISLGVLPPEAKPPANVLHNPSSSYTTWLESLPHSIKKIIVSKVSDCDIMDQLSKIKEGTRFVYLVFVEAMSFVPGSSYWSILFFLMYLFMGMTTMVGVMQGIITPLQDTVSLFRKHPKMLIVSVSVLMFLCGLFFTRPSGYYFMTLLSSCWLNLSTLLLITLENVSIVWVYGATRFFAELMTLMDRPISFIYRFLLGFLCPFMLIFLFGGTVAHISIQSFVYLAWDSNTSKEVTQKYPPWAFNLIVILVVTVFLPNFICFMYYLITRILISSIQRVGGLIVSKSLASRGQNLKLEAAYFGLQHLLDTKGPSPQPLPLGKAGVELLTRI
ncbi:PREDICTED: orphan sodium- and chloride-dependent neurotransmitter transporter NTT5 [Chrysochloris asiatica]|uniref:Orphan sodium- and chloride-dependent neurotransmitter transporter NTT5 n=1 Tax=Chrysochloris asiatica TaxID=185453 RepID=A0A9B0TR12_CHRAS|nr:PREDICTED: orphan sodium- and chloride-dependent neurotransmitter transporter NTT5 [Chrysochloris asiatica]